jgi:3-hydroxyisobutyrate dehydrogenase
VRLLTASYHHTSLGGDKSTFAECTPVHESIAEQWYLVGSGSSGVRLKLVVNLLLGAQMQALAEALSPGGHLLLDWDVLLAVLSKTTAIPPALTGKIQEIRNRDYSPQFPPRQRRHQYRAKAREAGLQCSGDGIASFRQPLRSEAHHEDAV